MKVKLDKGAYAPERAHKTDAGLDLRATNTDIIPANGSAVFDTGVHIQLPKGTAGVLISKSGLNVNRDITSTGLIDEGYTGSIKVKLYNHGLKDRIITKGDKITQLVIIPVLYEEVELSDKISGSDRGANGFGSTGK